MMNSKRQRDPLVSTTRGQEKERIINEMKQSRREAGVGADENLAATGHRTGREKQDSV